MSYCIVLCVSSDGQLDIFVIIITSLNSEASQPEYTKTKMHETILWINVFTAAVDYIKKLQIIQLTFNYFTFWGKKGSEATTKFSFKWIAGI